MKVDTRSGKTQDGGIDLNRWPPVKRYVDRIAARPKVREAMNAEGLK